MIIISRKSGRMGNRLFTFAHFMANSIEYGPYMVLSPVFNEYSDYFVGTSNQWITSFHPTTRPKTPTSSLARHAIRKVLDYFIYAITNPLRGDRIPFLSSWFHQVIDLHHPDVYEWKKTGFIDFVSKKIVSTNGWVFWDHESFIKHAQAIRIFFRLIPVLEERVRHFMLACRKPGTLLVGVHIRHGDYRTAGDGTYFYETRQYRDLMLQLALSTQQPIRFLVCSDEPVCHEDYEGLDIQSGPGTAIEDMYSLAACDYIMGPPSSFSGWASFYGQVPLHYVFDMEKSIRGISLALFSPLNSFDYRSASSRYEGQI